MSNEYLSNPKNDVVSPEKLSEQAWGEVQSVDEEEILGENRESLGRGRVGDQSGVRRGQGLGLWVGLGVRFGPNEDRFGAMPCFLLPPPRPRFIDLRNGVLGVGDFLESPSSDHFVAEEESENLKWGLRIED